ncbi:MAG: PEP-CTERM sorting domain-containing protein [Planctomycetes bacterium]|nr:PEP-CTERM sorting domain-containing protein [Planctomycetota bacterium]
MIDPNAWGTNASATDHTETFGYDYSADGIPEAPGFQAGDAAYSGLKLESNNTDFVTGAVQATLFPLGQSFSGTYELRFDMWQNYSTLDREQGGGAGTTEFSGGGIGYDDTTASLGVSAGAGHQLVTTGDGGSGSDYRGFKGAFFIPNADMVTGSRNATCCSPSDAYYALFPPGSGVPPAVQGQTGVPNENRAGSSAFQWYTHIISVNGNIITHQMVNDSGLRRNILIYDTTVLDPNNVVATDGNISIYYGDLFSSVSPSPGVTFGIVDNVIVTVPEPASILMLALGSLGFALVGRRRKAMKGGRCESRSPRLLVRQAAKLGSNQPPDC